MARVKRGVIARARHKKILKQAKGYYGARSRVYRVAFQAVIKAGHLIAAGDTKDITSDTLFKEVFSVDVQVDNLDNKPYVRVKGLL